MTNQAKAMRILKKWMRTKIQPLLEPLRLEDAKIPDEDLQKIQTRLEGMLCSLKSINHHLELKDTVMTARLYGIPNCNQMKKAREVFTAQEVEFEEINFKKQPPTRDFVQQALKALGKDTLINRQGTTFRRLGLKEATPTEEEWVELMLENPSLMKRPLVFFQGRFLCGANALQQALDEA